MTGEEVRMMFRAAAARAEELCRTSVRLRRESDQLRDRVHALADIVPASIPIRARHPRTHDRSRPG